jgi:ferredoxin-NADP reductase
MIKYIVKEVKAITADTVLLTLTPKRGINTLSFYPGQYAAIGFNRGLRPSPVRCFSILSSPNENGSIQFGIKVFGDFTKSISKLQVGNKVFIHGPFGDFGIDEDFDKSAVMLAGGIGITPFISNIRYLSEIKSNIKLTLLYSNKDQDNIPFIDELKYLESINPNFNVVHFITRGPVDKLKGSRVVRNRIDGQKLSQITNGKFNNFTYFICGPKLFTTNLTAELIDCGTDINRIMAEEFTPTGSDNLPNAANKRISFWTYSLTAATLAIAVVGIMGIDLIRYVPKYASVSNKTTTSNAASAQGSNTASSGSSSYSSGSSTSSVGSSTSTSPSSSSGNNSSNSSSQTYQQPTTSVS